MDTKTEHIIEGLRAGKSLRQIAKEVGLSHPSVRARAIRAGAIKLNSKFVKDGKAVCKKCKRTLGLDSFPQLANSKYICAECLREYMHRFQIEKVGCSKEQYDLLFKEQDGKCAICDREVGHSSKNGADCKLAVDHDHETGKIRGLLCNRCNRGLGFLENRLSRALEYVKRAR